jgi:hypothetical protein
MDERLEMARCAQRAVIALRLGPWDFNAGVGAMENPFACSLASKAGDREGARAWLGHGLGRLAAVVMHFA